MKLIFLNCWHSKLENELEKFVLERAPTTDIFLFQEANEPMQEICARIIPSYQKVLAKKLVNDKNEYYFQATYVHPDFGVTESKILSEGGLDFGLGIYTKIKKGNTDLHICNFHGPANPINKLDSSERLAQSKRLIDFFKELGGQKIIGGDFNLLPEAESVKMFKQNGFIDLIEKYKISTTRNRLAWDKFEVHYYFSDFVFVSPDILVNDFSCPNLEISDHLPMILEIN